MKLATLAVVMLCITFTIILYDQTSYVNTATGELDFYNLSEDISKEGMSTRVWNFLLEPSEWGTGSNLINYLVASLVGLLIVGGLVAYVTKSYAPDTYVFAIFYTGILGFGAIPVILLYGFIERNLGALMCVGDGFCFFPKIIAILIAGGLAFLWIIKCLSAWRTGQE